MCLILIKYARNDVQYTLFWLLRAIAVQTQNLILFILFIYKVMQQNHQQCRKISFERQNFIVHSYFYLESMFSKSYVLQNTTVSTDTVPKAGRMYTLHLKFTFLA